MTTRAPKPALFFFFHRQTPARGHTPRTFMSIPDPCAFRNSSGRGNLQLAPAAGNLLGKARQVQEELRGFAVPKPKPT